MTVGDLSASCREKAKDYRRLAREVDRRSHARALAVTTPFGKEVEGSPTELRRKFEKRAEEWGELASTAEGIEKHLAEVDDLQERVAELEAKHGIQHWSPPTSNGSRRWR